MARTSLLAAGCEKMPAKVDLEYRPSDGAPYKVTSTDDWWKLAARPEVIAAGIDALGLCAYNFGTRVPAEINWYLRNKVGCVSCTADRKNYKFSLADSPGIIYLPKAKTGVVPPSPRPPQPGTPPAGKLRLNSWIGIGAKFGSTVIIMGIEQMTGFIVSIQDLVNTESNIRASVLNAETTRIGIGVGASGGACIIYATGVANAGELNRLMTGGGDFNLALGGNAGAFFKAGKNAAKIRKLKPLIDVLIRIGAKTPGALNSALKAPDKLGDLYKAVTGLRDTLADEAVDAEPSVLVMDVPGLSGGTEAALFHAVTEFRTLGQPTIAINWSNAQQ